MFMDMYLSVFDSNIAKKQGKFKENFGFFDKLSKKKNEYYIKKVKNFIVLPHKFLFFCTFFSHCCSLNSISKDSLDRSQKSAFFLLTPDS